MVLTIAEPGDAVDDPSQPWPERRKQIVAGTTYAQADTVNFEAWALAVAAGSFATAVLLANNLRDIEQDREAGKRTLSVLIGSAATRALYGVLMALPYGVLVVLGFFYTGTGFVFFTLLLAIPAIVITATARTAKELILVLSLTSITALVWAIGTAAAIAL